jgi:hypothetical protein
MRELEPGVAEGTNAGGRRYCNIRELLPDTRDSTAEKYRNLPGSKRTAAHALRR